MAEAQSARGFKDESEYTGSEADGYTKGSDWPASARESKFHPFLAHLEAREAIPVRVEPISRPWSEGAM